jgi:lysine 2,3-aminomutase
MFLEDQHSPVKGLIRRYKDRALLELTIKCPVDCEFCFRKWKKERNQIDLTKTDIDKIVDFLNKEKEITEIIFSGGEPLMNLDLLKYAMSKIKKLPQIKVFRIHTRAVVTAPQVVSIDFLKLLKAKYRQIIYLSIHINSCLELNSKVEKAINNILKTGTILYSQSVFLKGINDSVEILEKLFKRLIELGVRPYNIYHCNEIEGIKHFVVPLSEEIKIMTELRKRISGFACPNLIVDTPGNANKIPTPLNFWKMKIDSFEDFEGNTKRISDI